ncbi:hypothetical protein V6R21_32370 [Limibacter armeniacum]|uniref:hypothetical protein n=1 Tax=Limibacter armeniacum TaxID=466084 RepID=UPI002FE63810
MSATPTHQKHFQFLTNDLQKAIQKKEWTLQQSWCNEKSRKYITEELTFYKKIMQTTTSIYNGVKQDLVQRHNAFVSRNSMKVQLEKGRMESAHMLESSDLIDKHRIAEFKVMMFKFWFAIQQETDQDTIQAKSRSIVRLYALIRFMEEEIPYEETEKTLTAEDAISKIL